MQGDVLRIMNANGVEVVSYAYDAWGKVLSVSGSLSSTVGAVNPFRYRGYYYDVETGWYYLNARYYDPNVGRFLSPDVILGANGGLQGYNLSSLIATTILLCLTTRAGILQLRYKMLLYKRRGIRYKQQVLIRKCHLLPQARFWLLAF